MGPLFRRSSGARKGTVRPTGVGGWRRGIRHEPRHPPVDRSRSSRSSPGPGRPVPRWASGPSPRSRRGRSSSRGRARCAASASPRCQRLLEEFADADGSPLTAKLASFGVSADQYLAMIPFLDGTGRPLCKGGQSSS